MECGLEWLLDTDLDEIESGAVECPECGSTDIEVSK
jgi:DNA-directed RNA polymerase subunit RPC12/RpoP